MAFYPHPGSLTERFGLVLASFLQTARLPFAAVLSEETIQQAFEEEDAESEKRGQDRQVPICAQHPTGRSGKLDLSPFFNVLGRASE